MEQTGPNPNHTVELLYKEQKVELPEGPFFEPETNQLLWVDIHLQTINFLNVATTQNRVIKLPDVVGAVIPVEGSDRLLLAAIKRKLCLVDRETGAINEDLISVEDDKPRNRFNDAKCDPNGRLWAGTMGTESAPGTLPPNEGNFYRFTAGNITLCVPDVSISNGIGWSLDNNTMYYIDSLPKKVYSFDYDLVTGAISNQKVFADYAKDDGLRFPDGMCTDSEGRLWVASFGAGMVTCWDPKTGKEIIRIKIPGANNCTSCCFGGPNFSWLFVTTASYGVKDVSKEPNAGGIFVIKDLGVKGLPADRFRH